MLVLYTPTPAERARNIRNVLRTEAVRPENDVPLKAKRLAEHLDISAFFKEIAASSCSQLHAFAHLSREGALYGLQDSTDRLLSSEIAAEQMPRSVESLKRNYRILTAIHVRTDGWATLHAKGNSLGFKIISGNGVLALLACLQDMERVLLEKRIIPTPVIARPLPLKKPPLQALKRLLHRLAA